MTAAVGLYQSLGINPYTPWAPAFEELPNIMYGASSVIGAYAVQLASRSTFIRCALPAVGKITSRLFWINPKVI